MGYVPIGSDCLGVTALLTAYLLMAWPQVSENGRSLLSYQLQTTQQLRALSALKCSCQLHGDSSMEISYLRVLYLQSAFSWPGDQTEEYQ